MTIFSPNSLNTGPSQFESGQPFNSITSSRMRGLIDSLAGMSSSTQTLSYIAALVDCGTRVLMNSAGAINFTIPPNTDVAFDVGTVMEIGQFGAGQVTIVAGSGVTIHSSNGFFATTARYSVISVWQQDIDVWWVSGERS